MKFKHFILAATMFFGTKTFAQVGIGTTSPVSTLDVRGSASFNTRSVTSTTTLTSTDHTIIYGGSSTATLTLPSASTCSGREIWIKNNTSYAVTIATASSQTIDGNSSWTISNIYETVLFMSNGTNWIVKQQMTPLNGSSDWKQGGNAQTAVKTLGTTGGYDLPIITNNTERMRITSGGNVGIGTTTPTYPLEIYSASNPLKISGLQSGASGDSVITVNSSGIIRKRNASAFGNSSTTHTMSLSGNTLTSTVNGTAATSNAVGSISNTSSTNSLSTTVNGITSSAVNIINSNATSLSGTNLTTTVNGVASTALNLAPAITAATTHTLTSATNTLTSTVNGVAATASAVNSVANTSSANNLTTTVNGVAATAVPIINTNALSVSGNKLTSNINGVSDTTIAVTSVANTSSANTLSTAVNGVAGSTVNIINSNGLTSSTNTLTSTVNGVASSGATIVNSHTMSGTSNAITSAVNGVSASITPSAGTIGSSNYLGFDASGNLVKGSGPTSSTTNTLTSATNTLTSTVNGVVATASAVNSVSNTSSSNILSTTVNGVSGSGVSIVNSIGNTSSANSLSTTVNGVTGTNVSIVNSLSNTSSGNNLTTSVNGVNATAVPIVNSISNTSSTNTLTTSVNGVAATGVNIINSNALTAASSALTSTVNGVASTLTPSAGTIGASTYLGFDASGNLVKGSTPAATTTNTLALATNTLTSTVNGVAATSSAVGSVSNTSSTNSLSTTVNGVAGTAVNIINSNATSLSGTNLTTTVNGVAATALDLSPAITSKAWSLTGNSGTTSGTNYIGTNDAQDLMLKTNSTERFTINKTTGFIHLNQQNQSTIMGYQAAQSSLAASATANVGIGYQAMYFNTSGNRNTAVGFVALSQNITGQDNTAIGIVALNNVKGNYNTGLGSSAGYSMTTGDKNIFVGHNSGISHSSGSSNIFIGDSVNYNGAASGSNLMNIGNAIYGSGLYGSTPFIGIGKSSPGSALDVKGTLRLSGSTSGYVGFVPAAAAGSTTYTLPSADGTSGYQLTTNGTGTLSWAAPFTITGLSNTSSANTLSTTLNGTTGSTVNIINSNALTAASSALTSTVNGVASTLTPSAGTIGASTYLGFDASGNLVKGSTPAASTTHTLSSATNTITSVVNGVSTTASAVNSVSNTSATNTLTTSVNGVAATGVSIINSNALSAASSALTSTVNGVASTLTPSAGTIAASTYLGFDASGNLVKGAVPSTSHTLSSATNTITSVVNGVSVTAAAVNSNTLTAASSALTSTVNGVASTLTPSAGTIAAATYLGFDASGNLVKGSTPSSSGWGLTGNASTTAGTNYIGTSDAIDFVTKTNATERMRVTSAGNVGIGATAPGQKLETMNGNILINNNNNTSGEIRIAEPSTSGSSYTAFKTQAQSASVTYTLPAADGSANSILQTDGSGTLSWSSMGTTRLVRKTADESVTSSTNLQDDDVLQLSIAANEIWEVTFRLRVVGTSAGDIKMAVTLPTGATMWLGAQADNTDSDDDYVEMTTAGTGYTFPGSGSNWNLNSTANMIQIKGLITNSSTAGTIKLQWAQKGSNSTSTTVKALSYLIASRLQ
ncbi:MAG: hypothetical protein RL708_236 [Bacteroidota bacterium]|jgi:trimeric autotransporter adhesin